MKPKAELAFEESSRSIAMLRSMLDIE